MRKTVVVSVGSQIDPELVVEMVLVLAASVRVEDRQSGKMEIIHYEDEERFGEKIIKWLRDHGYPKAEIVSEL